MYAHKNYIFTPTPRIALPIKKRTFWTIVILTTFLLTSGICGLYMGSVDITAHDLWQFFQGNFKYNNATETIYQLRLPRVVMSILAGASMALSGHLIQTIAKNPLADPGVLGLTDGALLMLILSVIIFPNIRPLSATFITFLGAILTGILTLFIVRHRSKGIFILLVGLGIGATLSAISDAILSVIQIDKMALLLVKISGSFSSVDDTQMIFMIIYTSAIIALYYMIARPITLLSLGDSIVKTMGINTTTLYIKYALLAIMAMAPVVALAGAINFIGLISTFFAKHLIGHRGNELGTVSMLIGAIITTWADTLGRTVFAPTMIHAGLFITIIGVGMFILICIITSKKN